VLFLVFVYGEQSARDRSTTLTRGLVAGLAMDEPRHEWLDQMADWDFWDIMMIPTATVIAIGYGVYRTPSGPSPNAQKAMVGALTAATGSTLMVFNGGRGVWDVVRGGKLRNWSVLWTAVGLGMYYLATRK
jgi:hypothetical protein